MHNLARMKIDSIEYRADIFKKVLSHFGDIKDTKVLEMISAAIDAAYTDDIMFEDFKIWTEEQNDDALLYQVDHFSKNRDRKPISESERNLTGKKEKIETLQKDAEHEAAQSFAKKLQSLASKKGLKTNEAIGKFLGGMLAEQVRVLLDGKHKPQRKTLLRVAEAFKVPIESLIED
jgi:transglutaminase/protease-like cytokinesis protein 3